MNDAEILTAARNHYHLHANGVSFWPPYFINSAALSPDPANFKPGPYKGKGTPQQIQAWVNAHAARHPELRTAAQWRQALIQHAMGIDCSGYVYYLLDTLLQKRRLGRLWDHLYIARQDLLDGYEQGYRAPGFTKEKLMSYPEQVLLHTFCQDFNKDPRRNTNVRRLVSDAATVAVGTAAKAQPGDMLYPVGPDGDHIGMVIRNDGRTITYTDSVGRDLLGVSIYTIKITNLDAGLDQQDWGKQQWYVDRYQFKGLRRLKALA